MAKFAVYTIPPAASNIYRRGSEILGYDVRTGQMLPSDNETRRALPTFDETWVAQPQSYGFHMTTGYSLFFEMARLPEIEREMEDVFNCFGADVEFWLHPAATGHIPFWRDEIAVLHYEPNPAMLMLHTMLVARVNPLGTSSNPSRKFATADPATLDPVQAHRVRRYYTPYMLDGWRPHFSLMYPYAGDDPIAMRAALTKLFPPEPLQVESICLCVRGDDETYYRLHREFHFDDFPQPLTS